jgi:pimeloyl-ACP methyl ester carboxylesterase
MGSTFYRLLDNTLAEVCRREPTYPSRFPINLSNLKEVASRYFQHPQYAEFPRKSTDRAIGKALGYIAKSWTKTEQLDNANDPVARWLCESIVDAFCADQGVLPLEPQRDTNQSISEVFARQYSEKWAPGGLGYFIRNKGSSPLLLVDATGTPIDIWRRFLGDPVHDFKIIVPRRRGGDLFRGGLQQHVDIRSESTDFISVLNAESIEKANVVAWCNGARLAIDLASWQAGRVSSLVLIGPMLKGIKGVTPSPSLFERDLQPLLDAVARQSTLAPFLSKTIAQQAKSPDWDRLANDSEKRAQALFGLPAKDHAYGILAPMTEPASFINVSRRVSSDEAYPVDQALAQLQTRTMVIMGSHDQVVSNPLAESAMKQMCRNSVVKVVLMGGGHYIQDLQYHYLRLMLTAFFGHRRPPPNTARSSVEDLRP